MVVRLNWRPICLCFVCVFVSIKITGLLQRQGYSDEIAQFLFKSSSIHRRRIGVVIGFVFYDGNEIKRIKRNGKNVLIVFSLAEIIRYRFFLHSLRIKC